MYGLERAHLELQHKRDPLPLPPKEEGDAPKPAELHRHFCWVLRHYYLGESWRVIGKRDGIDHATVSRGARSLVKYLPSTWAEVFSGRRPGVQLDELLPIDRLRVMMVFKGR